jgi:preprotein translocase subunit SecG
VIYVLITLHVIVSVFLILVVLLQQGKGADLSVFGGGSTQAAFGARGAATLLHKLTVAGFILFTLTTLTIQILKGRLTGSTVLSGVKEPAPQSAPATPGPAPATSEGSATGTTPAGTPPGAADSGTASAPAPNPPAQVPAEAPAGT